jgi:hypothetical protein
LGIKEVLMAYITRYQIDNGFTLGHHPMVFTIERIDVLAKCRGKLRKHERFGGPILKRKKYRFDPYPRVFYRV